MACVLIYGKDELCEDIEFEMRKHTHFVRRIGTFVQQAYKPHMLVICQNSKTMEGGNLPIEDNVKMTWSTIRYYLPHLSTIINIGQTTGDAVTRAAVKEMLRVVSDRVGVLSLTFNPEKADRRKFMHFLGYITCCDSNLKGLLGCDINYGGI